MGTRVAMHSLPQTGEQFLGAVKILSGGKIIHERSVRDFVCNRISSVLKIGHFGLKIPFGGGGSRIEKTVFWEWPSNQ